MTDRKAAIITGAGTGVGAASAKWLAAHGYDVLVNYNKSKAAADSVAETCRAYGDALAVQGDVSDDSHCRRMVDAAFSKLGRVNAVLPGMIQGHWLKDGIGEDGYERMKKQWSDGSALGTVCTPEQVADVITGQLITVDAGMSLGKPPVVAR